MISTVVLCVSFLGIAAGITLSIIGDFQKSQTLASVGIIIAIVSCIAFYFSGPAKAKFYEYWASKGAWLKIALFCLLVIPWVVYGAFVMPFLRFIAFMGVVVVGAFIALYIFWKMGVIRR